jgi:ParB family transcriptional regulator, chromosome partitioning protein
MLQYIEVDKIVSHPDNPRKDFGDLSELAESIKAKGILQNLTVVPYIGEEASKPIEDMYRVIIGYRRLAAAKLAGLKEVPCIISNMDYKDQVATMLLENMQRSDLTLYEQAHGFQMMIDLGESVKNIAQKTGFLDTTVRNRVKLLELDQENFKKSAKRGATLQDYMKLNEIENVELRNSVLEKVGTQNFNYELKQAIDKEKTQNYIASVTDVLKTFAIKVENSAGMESVHCYYASNKDSVTVPDDAGTVKYFYTVSKYGYVYLYKEHQQSEKDAAEAEKRKKAKEKKKALSEISKRAFDLRSDFVKNFTAANAKKHICTIMEYALRYTINSYVEMDTNMLLEILNIKAEMTEDGEDEIDFNNIAEKFNISPEYVFLVSVYCSVEDANNNYYTWEGSYYKNEALDFVYDFLGKLGYEISDEEQTLKDGTNRLFGDDPFYSVVNQAHLNKAISDLDAGKGTAHELIEDDNQQAE